MKALIAKFSLRRKKSGNGGKDYDLHVVKAVLVFPIE
jgi:hypothetical protein